MNASTGEPGPGESATDARQALLRDFLREAERLWDCYRQVGPGRVPDEVASAWVRRRDALDAPLSASGEPVLPPAIRASVDAASDLLFRCAYRSEGLCFVTGEAGLLPRADLIQQLETALDQLRDAVHAG